MLEYVSYYNLIITRELKCLYLPICEHIIQICVREMNFVLFVFFYWFCRMYSVWPTDGGLFCHCSASLAYVTLPVVCCTYMKKKKTNALQYFVLSSIVDSISFFHANSNGKMMENHAGKGCCKQQCNVRV